jgi:hypothetical protein
VVAADENDPAASPEGVPPSAPRIAAKRTPKRWVLGRTETTASGDRQIVFEDGSTQRIGPALGPNTTWVQEGSVRHDVAADPDGQQLKMEADPAAFVIRILRERRSPLTKQQIEPLLDDLHLKRAAGWWQSVTKGLKADSHIDAQRGSYQWSDREVPKDAPKATTTKARAARPDRPGRPRNFGEVTVRQGEPAGPAEE